ncbi:MAG: hemagglutinin repeat-containing protein [Alphaproteobacteria bacterium]|nr:hemagglutinin repeat-containing protein [Alphaproteobacteria bacterium]
MDNLAELLSEVASGFSSHKSNTGQFSDTGEIEVTSTGSGSYPWGMQFTTTQVNNLTFSFNDSGGGGDSVSKSSSSVDYNQFGGWNFVREWRPSGSDYLLHKKTTVTQTISSDATSASVYAGGDLTINADSLRNRSSVIEASGDMTLSGTDLNNEQIQLRQTVEWKLSWGSWTAGRGYGIRNSSSPDYSWESGKCSTENGMADQNCFGEGDADRYQFSYSGDANIQAAGTLNATFTNDVSTTGAIRAGSASITATSIQNGLPTGSIVNITSNQSNAVSLTPSNLANLNSLYSYDPSGSSQYLISASISLPGQQLTVDHLINQLTAGAGYSGGLPFLADPFVENRLLRQASLEATGSNFVLENVEANDEAQREALYNNAADFANSRNDVVLGTALNETQLSELTAPVLWYVTENVGGNDVLVPTLYLPTVENLEISPIGEIVAENNLVLQAEETITNTGSIEAGGTVVLQAQDITNETLRTRGFAQTGSGEVGFDTAAGTASIEGGTVVLVADSEDGERGNITNTGGAITGTDAEGRVIISASGDVVNQALVVQAVEDVEVGNLGKTLGKSDYTIRDEYVSGTIGGAGNVTILSEGEVFNTASAINANGDILISATEGFTQTNLSDTFVVEDSVNVGGGSSSSSSSSASSTGEGYRQENNAQASASASSNVVSGSYREGFVNQSASVSGANVTIYSSEGDITSIGSSINSSGETILFAEDGSISLEAASIITNSADFAVSTGGNAQASAGGSGVEYNANAEASATAGVTASSSQDATFISSTVGGENVTLIAGEDISGIGAQLAAANNLVLDAGNDVSFTAAQETLESTNFSAGVTSRVYAEAGTTSSQIGTPDAAVGTDTSVSVGFGASSTTSSQTSSLSAGGNVVVNAGNNIDLVGTDLAAGQNIALTAVNDVTIEALAEESSSFGVGFSGSIGAELGSGGLAPTGSAAVGVSTSEGTAFRESNVNAGGSFTIDAGGNAELTGVNINTGGDTNITATSVLIASAQDTLNETGVGLGVSTQGTSALDSAEGDDPPLSFNFNQTDAVVTTNQAQINTGGNLNVTSTGGDVTLNSLQVNVDGDANLTAAEGFDVTIGENRDRVDTVGVNIELTVETGLGDTVSGLADGIATAVETGDVGSVVGGIPGVNRVAQTIAAIESGDATQIAGALGGPVTGGIVGAIDQFALDGELSNNANPTGTSVGNDILDFTGGNSGGGNTPTVSRSGANDALQLAQNAQSGDLSDLSDLESIDGDIDARLGVTVTETSATTSVGSTVNVQGNLNVTGENINVIGSDVSTVGDTTLIAENTINLVAGENTFDGETIEAGVTVGFDVINQDVRVGADGAFSEESSNSFNEGSLTSGGTLILQSGGDTNVLSNNVQATDIVVDTGGDLNVQTLQAQRDSQTYAADLTVEVGITGDSGAGEVNFDGNIQSGSTTGQQASLIATNDLTINSANDVNVNSAIVGAGNDATINAEGDITFTANIDETNDETFGGGASVSVNQQGEDSNGGSGSLDFNYQNNEADTVASQSVLFGGNSLTLNAGNDVTLADTAASGDEIIITAENDVNILTTQSTTTNFGVGGNIAVGGSSSGESGEGEDSGEFALGFNFNDGDTATINEQGTVQAGSNLIIQSGGNTNIIGSDVSSDGDATLDVGGDLTVTTLQDTVDSIDVSGSIEASGSSEDGSGSGGGSLEFGLDLQDSATSNTVAGINAGGNLQITTGGDTTLTGSVVEGGTVDVNIGGDLTITSLQNTADNVNVELAAGTAGEDGESTGFNLEAGVEIADVQQTNVISGITATSGDLNTKVGGTTSLTGALIASTAEGGQTNLTTENLVVADLGDEVLEVDAGVNLGIGSGGDQSLNAGANLGITQGDGTTVSTIGEGNLVITSGEEVEVNRDLTQLQEFSTDIDIQLEGDIEVSQDTIAASGSATVDGTTVEGGISAGADGLNTNLSVTEGGEETAEDATGEEEELTPAQQALALAQAAVANAGQAQDQGPVATTEQMNTILGQFRVGADVTPVQAQAASENVYNGGNPATSPVLDGLSPAQKVIVLNQARVWLNSEEQVVLDRAIQQITTGADGSPVPVADDDS